MISGELYYVTEQLNQIANDCQSSALAPRAQERLQVLICDLTDLTRRTRALERTIADLRAANTHLQRRANQTSPAGRVSRPSQTRQPTVAAG